MKSITTLAALGLALGITSGNAQADSFGSGGNAFTIDFVTVGNAGNGNDAAFDDIAPDFSSPYGRVDYTYRMGVYEISQDMITKATAGGLANVTAGAHTGAEPAANMSWYEAAAFVNWLNQEYFDDGAFEAYDLTWDGSSWSMAVWDPVQAWQVGGENLYRHKDAYYFLPSEDEWYKAAYHKNDGVTANYWDYATGSNAIPTAVAGGTAAETAVFGQLFNNGPADITNAGGLSSYLTMGQSGNVFEWNESASDGLNNSSSAARVGRGGYWSNTEDVLRSSFRGDVGPSVAANNLGFRVASVPEPSSALLMVAGLGAFLLMRRRNSAL